MIEEEKKLIFGNFSAGDDNKYYDWRRDGYTISKNVYKYSCKVTGTNKEWLPYFAIITSDLPYGKVKTDMLRSSLDYQVGNKIYEYTNIEPYSLKYEKNDRYNHNMFKVLRDASMNFRKKIPHYSDSPVHTLSKEKYYKLFAYFLVLELNKLEDVIKNREINHVAMDNNIQQKFYWKYSHIFNHFYFRSGFQIFGSRDPRLQYVIGPYYIAHYDRITGNTKPLVSLVIKSKYLPYYKGAIVTSTAINPKHVELWVDSSFDITGSMHKGLRPKYRKFIKKELIELGVKVVVKENLDKELFNQYSLPSDIRTINQFQTFCEESGKEMLTQFKIENYE
jgi:hypothetical protein